MLFGFAVLEISCAVHKHCRRESFRIYAKNLVATHYKGYQKSNTVAAAAAVAAATFAVTACRYCY